MPFVSRVTDIPPLNVLGSLEQIILVDKTGPVIPLGAAPGSSCLVAEFLKGPFSTYEPSSSGEIVSLYGGVSNLLSQTIAGVQDGSGGRYDGNGAVALLGKQFLRLALQRVDCDGVTTDGGAVKACIKFDVTIDTSDQDPITATITGRDIVIPAGTRFADAAISSAVAVIATSQDIVIPKGSTITANKISISYTLTSDPATGILTRAIDSTGALVSGALPATFFFVKGTTAAIAAINTAVDTALPGVLSTIAASGISTVDAAVAGTAIYPPNTGASLAVRIEAQYSAAIDKTRPTNDPMVDIQTIWAARRGQTAAVIRTPLENNAINSSVEGRGRVALVSGPRVGSATGDAASASAAKTEVLSTTPAESPGRSDRKIIGFPFVKVFSSDLQKNVVVGPDGFMAATLNQFPEEKNPGAMNSYIQSIQNYEDAFVASPLFRADYVSFKAKGIAALKNDRAVGWWFQSGVTSVDPAVDPTHAPIKRRRMADLIQDTLAQLGAPFNKEPATVDRIDQLLGEIDAFLSLMKNPPNASQQRIQDYLVDGKTGNTPALMGLGIFVIKVTVRLLASMDTIVFLTTIGETVTITQT